MADDTWAPPEGSVTPEAARAPLGVMIPLLMCAGLGAVGVLTTCYSGVAVAMSQSGLTPGVSPEQAQVIEEIRAQQGWWVIPMAVVQLLLKMGLSLGLVVGGVQVLRRQASGVAILLPVLLFGIVFELFAGFWGAGSTLWNWEQMAAQFAAQMAADPNMPPEMAEAAGSMFGATMVGTMLFMLVWAVAKAALYGWTHRQLRGAASEEWRASFE